MNSTLSGDFASTSSSWSARVRLRQIPLAVFSAMSSSVRRVFQPLTSSRIPLSYSRASRSRLAMLFFWIADDPPMIGISSASRT